jgi:hypothetical protein
MKKRYLGRSLWVWRRYGWEFDIKGAADNITVSGKFTYLKPAISEDQVGLPIIDFQLVDWIDDFPQMVIQCYVVQNCYWAEGCQNAEPERRPHLINCWPQNQRFRSFSWLRQPYGTICYVEKCDFEQASTTSSPVSEGSLCYLKFDDHQRD